MIKMKKKLTKKETQGVCELIFLIGHKCPVSKSG